MRLYGPSSKFTTKEFACKCGCGFGTKEEHINKTLIDTLNQIRKMYGPMKVNSGARCKKYNKSIGGSTRSAHLPHISSGQCRAVDISVTTGKSRHKLVKLGMDQFNRVGIHKKFVHFDVAWDNPSPRLFLY